MRGFGPPSALDRKRVGVLIAGETQNPPTMSFLHVQGREVVDEKGKTVILRGAGLGGVLNMENFITGYPGSEHGHHASMRAVLGDSAYERFFEKFVRAFWDPDDAKFFRSLGLNCLRIPFNYRHFEDDMNPFVLKHGAFEKLDWIVDTCAKEGIYTILDLHAAPGYQNQDWHSDNPTSHAFFWEHLHFQDRTVWLWKEISAHYKDNPWVAGYNPINEPADPQHVRLQTFYARLVEDVRHVDDRHILWLEGNTYAMDFSHFQEIYPNCVYACHDYSTFGFPFGKTYTGSADQRDKLRQQFQQKITFMKEHGTPVWNGEFGPVYANPIEDGPACDDINKARIAVLEEQLKLYDEESIHWSIWLYKDIGLQGMIHVSPNSLWLKTIGEFVQKKNKLMADAWGNRPNPQVVSLFQKLAEWIDSNSGAQEKYPDNWSSKQHLMRIVRNCYLSEGLQKEFASLFQGFSDAQLTACAESFSFANCVQRKELNAALSRAQGQAG